MTQKQSKHLTPQSQEPQSLLEAMHNKLPELLSASGIAVVDTEPQIAAGKSKLTFVPRKRTKQTHQ
jgi:hypothetical protein